jgi:hypothetical protein
MILMVAASLRVRVRLRDPALAPPRAVLFGCLDGMALALVSFWGLGFFALIVSKVF